jgi:hypothetical protein
LTIQLLGIKVESGRQKASSDDTFDTQLKEYISSRFDCDGTIFRPILWHGRYPIPAVFVVNNIPPEHLLIKEAPRRNLIATSVVVF